MSITAEQNQRYVTPDGASVYNTKQNINSFFTDLANLQQYNLVRNSFFLFAPSGTDFTLWDNSGVSGITFDNANKLTTAAFASGGYIRQNIAASGYLEPNESYTAILYAYSNSASALEFSVYAVSGDQVYNLSDPLEENSATYIAGSASGMQKYILQFSTNLTAIQGEIYVKIKNRSATQKTFSLRQVMVYRGLIELAGLAYLELNQHFIDDLFFDTGNQAFMSSYNFGADKMFLTDYTNILTDDQVVSKWYADQVIQPGKNINNSGGLINLNDSILIQGLTVSGGVPANPSYISSNFDVTFNKPSLQFEEYWAAGNYLGSRIRSFAGGLSFEFASLNPLNSLAYSPQVSISQGGSITTNGYILVNDGAPAGEAGIRMMGDGGLISFYDSVTADTAPGLPLPPVSTYHLLMDGGYFNFAFASAGPVGQEFLFNWADVKAWIRQDGFFGGAGFQVNSSERYKYNINTFENALSTVCALRGVTYNRKVDDRPQIGLIAEEVYEIIPQVVELNGEGQPDSIQYDSIIGVLVEAVKELKTQISALQMEINTLKGAN